MDKEQILSQTSTEDSAKDSAENSSKYLEAKNNFQFAVIRKIFNLPKDADIPNDILLTWTQDKNGLYSSTFNTILNNLPEEITNNFVLRSKLAESDDPLAEHVKDEILKLHPELNISHPH